MRKRICCVLLSVLCLLQLTSCGNKGAGDSAPQNTEVNVLKEMESANSNETLSAKYDRVAFRFTYTYADEVVISEYYYQDADRYVSEAGDWVEIDENGDVYGFDDETKLAHRGVFLEDAYADYKNTHYGLAYYEFDPNEVILSRDEKDGIISLYTKIIRDKDSVDEFAGYYLFEAGAVDHFEVSYKVDAQTYEIIEYIQFAVLTDGTKRSIIECVRVQDPEKYVVDEQLKKLIFGDEQRTLTITTYPGTAKETVYTQTVSKGSVFAIYSPRETLLLYTDAECTTLYSVEDPDLTADLNLYYK